MPPASPPASCLPSKLRPGLVASASLPILTGYGQHNYFRQEYEGSPDWDWGLETTYGEKER